MCQIQKSKFINLNTCPLQKSLALAFSWSIIFSYVVCSFCPVFMTQHCEFLQRVALPDCFLNLLCLCLWTWVLKPQCVSYHSKGHRTHGPNWGNHSAQVHRNKRRHCNLPLVERLLSPSVSIVSELIQVQFCLIPLFKPYVLRVSGRSPPSLAQTNSFVEHSIIKNAVVPPITLGALAKINQSKNGVKLWMCKFLFRCCYSSLHSLSHVTHPKVEHTG